MIWALLQLILLSSPTHASQAAEACLKLTKNDKSLAKKCHAHLVNFELDHKFAEACTQIHNDVDVRMRCLRSGANLDTVKICKGAKWSLDGTLTCLRSYPSREIIAKCQSFLRTEEDQLRCVRSGRDGNQIQACLDYVQDKDQRFICLGMDLAKEDTGFCARKNPSAGSRMQCLERIAKEQERRVREYEGESRARALASDAEPIFAE